MKNKFLVTMVANMKNGYSASTVFIGIFNSDEAAIQNIEKFKKQMSGWPNIQEAQFSITQIPMNQIKQIILSQVNFE